MKIFKRILLVSALLIILSSVYAHLLHPALFFSRQPVTYADSFALQGGSEVSFQSGPYTLRGRLKAPKDVAGKVPAIIFCDGSGGQSSYATTYYSKFIDSLYEHNLPQDSLAFLYFEKRGVGKSEGTWYNTSFEQRAEDVKAAADYLKSLPFIDTSKIAVVGHSQGGWIVQICLSKYGQAFAGGISMAGPTFGVKEQVVNDYASSLICKEKLDEEKAWEKAINKVNFDFLFASAFPFQQEWKQLSIIKQFDPAGYLKTVNKPLLLLFCENDALVSPKKSLARLNEVFPNGHPSNIQTVTVKGANHGFKLSELCYKGSYKNIPFSEEGKQEINQWVRAVLFE